MDLQEFRDEMRLYWRARAKQAEGEALLLAMELAAVRKELAEWQRLRDPVVLHVSLLRGLPAKLDRDLFLHLAGTEPPKVEHENA